MHQFALFSFIFDLFFPLTSLIRFARDRVIRTLYFELQGIPSNSHNFYFRLLDGNRIKSIMAIRRNQRFFHNGY